MPLYEYRCRACGHTTELLRAPAEADAGAPCRCGATDSARLPSLISRSRGATLPMAAGPAASGSCCGGGCCG